MDKTLKSETVLFFTIPTTVLIIVASLGGLMFGSTYSRETASWYAQAIAQDIANLVIIVPTLLVSAFFVTRGKKSALFVWLGAMLYTAYTFVIYSFGVHFNSLFLVYCWALGLSLYSLIVTTAKLSSGEVKSWFDETRREYLVSSFVLIAGVLFYLMWLKEDLPAMIVHHTPMSLQENGLMTNPVHVLDFSLVLPGFIITSILLLRQHPIGYFFTPILLVFAALMDMTIAWLVVFMNLRGTTGDIALTAVFVIVAAICLMVLVIFLRHMKKPNVSTVS